MSIHPIAGIDYGNGMANIDRETNIRYGVISLNDIDSEAIEWFTPVYSSNEEYDEDEQLIDSEPINYIYESKDGYVLQYAPDSFWLWVFKSPFITECKFCSPCVPGAGDLNTPIKGGVTTYCLDSSWFEGNKAPYEYTKLG